VTQETHSFDEDDAVRLTGTIDVPDDNETSILVDIMGESGAGYRPAYQIICDATGQLDILVPEKLGAVVVTAYLDVDGNGPSDSDPAGVSKTLEVGTDAISGIEVEIEAGTDMSAYRTMQDAGPGVVTPVDPDAANPPDIPEPTDPDAPPPVELGPDGADDPAAPAPAPTEAPAPDAAAEPAPAATP